MMTCQVSGYRWMNGGISFYLFHRFSIPDMTDNTGSSISGPITSAREMSGRLGKVTTAMARESGELRASVVKFNATISRLGNFCMRPTT